MIENLWTGSSLAHRIGRVALAPLEGLYRSAVAVRGELFDRGVLKVTPSPIDVVSVGNVTVGGTGKTPVSAHIAARLAALGRKPAIVLRGYGEDEPLVHARLNPDVPVIVDPDRVRGIRSAADRGADVVVLDDAFQHRRAGRSLDLLLVSADDWTGSQRMLPAGPYRESPEAIRRASAVIVTVKAASDAAVNEVSRWVSAIAPSVPVAVARLMPADLVRVVPPGETRSVDALAAERIVAVAAVGNPGAFFRQLESLGASVIPAPFGDHHAFTAGDLERIGRLGRGASYVVCTLKDAVKIAPLWPASNGPLWYVSLSVEVESGAVLLDDLLRRLPGRQG
jgi:tetraacyldisaccharide 4'-kinase